MLFDETNLNWFGKTILNEAPVKTDDYQLPDDTTADDEGDNPPTDPEDGATPDDTTDEDTDNYQLDNADTEDDTSDNDMGDNTGDDTMGGGNDMGDDTMGGGNDMGDDTMGGGNDMGDGNDIGDDMDSDVETDVDDSKLKKYILLNQFKEISTLINNFSLSIENLTKKAEYINDENIDYLQSKIEDLKQKMSFVITKKFLKADYKELLKIFYYFKFNLNDLTNFAENLIKQHNN